MAVRFLGRSAGDWVTLALVVWFALVLIQLLADGARRYGGGTGGSVAGFVERRAGLN